MKSAMIPCKFNLEQMEHPNLLKCRLKVAKTGKNWNGSKFSIESFKKAENTLKNIPILAYIKQTRHVLSRISAVNQMQDGGAEEEKRI